MSFTALDFYTLINSKKTNLSQEQIKNSARFAEILYRENEVQNLTRIIGLDAFFEGHLLDVIELYKANQLGERVLDVGSGSGCPGLLSATIDSSSSRIWFLSESEKSKADYLKASAKELSLARVSVLSERAENVIQVIKPDTVIARAVGSVEKIAGWISNCSTWNKLVLFKGKGWENEWEEAKNSRFGKKLTIIHKHEYSSEEKYRVLITLTRNRK